MTFSDILPILQQSKFFLILLSAFCGALVGLEREANHKPAGVRTCSLVCMGSVIFSLVSIHALTFIQPYITGLDVTVAFDPTRIASNIVQGIGFLGACCVWTFKDKVNGITTAAAIWVVAAIGMAIGFGHIGMAFNASLLCVFIMFGIGYLERIFRRKQKTIKEN